MLDKHDLRWGVGFVLIVSVLGGAGCSKIREKIEEKATEKAIEGATGGAVKIDNGNGTVTLTNKDKGTTATVGAQAKLPDHWPSDVPVYPGASIVGSVDSDDGQMVTLESTDAPDKVISFYKSKLSSYKKEGEMDTGDFKLLTMKSGQHQVAVATSGKDGKTSVQLTSSTNK